MLETPAQLLDPVVPAPVRPAVVSVAMEVPTTTLHSAELAERLGLSEEWIVSRTGVRERPLAGPDERLADYAARAGARALERAGVDAADLDLVVVGTMTADEVMPNAAPLIAGAIGATRAGAFDVGAACTAFLSGLAVGAAQIESGRARQVLVIGADFISRVNNWEDKRSAPLFADATGAVVLSPANGKFGGIGPILLGADSSGAESIVVDHADRKVRMDGPEVYRHAVARMSESTTAAVAAAGLTLDDIDLFVYHQANSRITRALGEKLGLAPERVVDCIATFGNSSAGTIPVALAVAEREGRLKPGALVHLGAFGAGFTWGGGVIQWGGAEGA